MLLKAAAEASQSYQDWIEGGERRRHNLFRRAHPDRHPLRLIPLILSDPRDAAEASMTAANLRTILGDTTVIYATSPAIRDCTPLPVQLRQDLGEALSFLADREPNSWLLPALAGDRFSHALGDILSRLLVENSVSSIVYWDEDRISSMGRSDPWIKPDWDPLFFGSFDGVAGACAIWLGHARVQAERLGSLRLDRNGIKELSLALASDARDSVPQHVPLVLTHRYEAHALRWDLGSSLPSSDRTKWPSVSILIPTRDKAELLDACLRGLEKTAYPGLVELIVIDNGSTEAAALRILESLKTERRARVLHRPGPFNFSRLNNDGAVTARGEFLCFLNNDVEPLEPDWLRNMISRADDAGVGAVGALLLYPSGRIQHAGVAIGIGGAAGHVQKGIDPSDRRFRTWHAATRQVSAVTAAVMVIRKSSFQGIGGFDESAFPVAFNDVDLCLRLKRGGFKNIFVAEARLLHRESESRGDDRSPEHLERFASELCRLQARWNTQEYVDPHYSPLFSQIVERCVLAP